MAGEPKVRDGFGRGENRRVGINNHALIFQISRYGVNTSALMMLLTNDYLVLTLIRLPTVLTLSSC